MVALWRAANQPREAEYPIDSTTLSTESVEQMCVTIENYLINEVLKDNQPPEAVDNIEAEVALAHTGIRRFQRCFSGQVGDHRDARQRTG